MDGDPEVARLLALAARFGRRGPGAAARPGAARQLPGSAALGRRRGLLRPGTSRSASCRWRRWPAACPVVATAVGGLLDTVVDRGHRSARPAAGPGGPGRRARGTLLGDPAAASGVRPARRWNGSGERFSWDEVAARTTLLLPAPDPAGAVPATLPIAGRPLRGSRPA